MKNEFYHYETGKFSQLWKCQISWLWLFLTSFYVNWLQRNFVIMITYDVNSRQLLFNMLINVNFVNLYAILVNGT